MKQELKKHEHKIRSVAPGSIAEELKSRTEKSGSLRLKKSMTRIWGLNLNRA